MLVKNRIRRRDFVKGLGMSAAAMPFVAGLPGLRAEAGVGAGPRKRLVVMFSPNGTLPDEFWPDTADGKFEFGSILEPLAPYRDRVTTLRGVSNLVRGDGDNHMRGMSCLLTGTFLHPGNIQGGSHTPAGWASGISIDQEVANFLQSREETRTRFGSLQFGVAVPNRADPWTRMSYAGSNKPLAPIDDPYQMLSKLYGKMKDKESLASILDDVRGELKFVERGLGAEDRAMLDEHLTLVREMERELQTADESDELAHPEPELDPGVELVNDNTPRISRMQIDLMVNAFANDMTRVATLQYMRSVGQARMRWLDVEEGHHSLSHEPDGNGDAQDKLRRINQWFAGEFAYLVKRLAETPEPGGEGSMLDHTQLVWANELGKGNSHTLDDIPFVLAGGACGFKNGRGVEFDRVAHNRLWLSVARGMGHETDVFGMPELSHGGALDLWS